MTLQPSWEDIALRLALTLLAGGLLGLNRGVHGRAVGLRTTWLVTLAASLAMLLANSLVDTTDRPPESFVTMDVMRLPLGVLTGIGFIGAGAIFRNDTLITGVTTAATLWLATMIGLCLGAGEISLGLVSCGIGFLILNSTRIEAAFSKDRMATLEVWGSESLSDDAVRGVLESFGVKVSASSIRLDNEGKLKHLRFEIERRESSDCGVPPPFLQLVAELPHVSSLEWKAVMLPV